MTNIIESAVFLTLDFLGVTAIGYDALTKGTAPLRREADESPGHKTR